MLGSVNECDSADCTSRCAGEHGVDIAPKRGIDNDQPGAYLCPVDDRKDLVQIKLANPK
jgi:hypothetical protein